MTDCRLVSSNTRRVCILVTSQDWFTELLQFLEGEKKESKQRLFILHRDKHHEEKQTLVKQSVFVKFKDKTETTLQWNYVTTIVEPSGLMADNNWLLAAICTHLVLSITLIRAAVLPRGTIQHPTDIICPQLSTHHFFTPGDQSRRPSQRDARNIPGTLISTLARQLRSCNAATRTSKSGTRTHLKGADGVFFLFFLFG